MMTRLESRFSQIDLTWVTINDSRLESESFLQNLCASYGQTQSVCTQSNGPNLFQWWSKLTQILCFFCLVVPVMCPTHFYQVRVSGESLELSSHFKSLVCKLESMSNQMKLHILFTYFFALKWHPTCYKTAPDKLENGVQHAMKWHLLSWKMVTNVVLASLIAGYLYLSFAAANSSLGLHRIVARKFSIGGLSSFAGGLCVCLWGAWHYKINQNSSYL